VICAIEDKGLPEIRAYSIIDGGVEEEEVFLGDDEPGHGFERMTVVSGFPPSSLPPSLNQQVRELVRSLKRLRVRVEMT
jgi:hypothetical protein